MVRIAGLEGAIPHFEREVAAAEREVEDAYESLAGLPAASIQLRHATTIRLSRAEAEVGNRERELANARAELEAARALLPQLQAQLSAAFDAMQAALRAYRACLQHCVTQAADRVDDRGEFARQTIHILNQGELAAIRRRVAGPL